MPFTLTHGIIPYALASIFTKNKILRWIALLGGIFPDLDGLPILFNKELFYQIHHELLHAPILGFVLAIPIAILVRKFYGIKMWKTYIAFSLGFAIHSITDVLFTTWYVRLLWPISQIKISQPIKLFWPFSDQGFNLSGLMELNILLTTFVLIFIIWKIIKFVRTGRSIKEEIISLLPK